MNLPLCIYLNSFLIHIPFNRFSPVFSQSIIESLVLGGEVDEAEEVTGIVSVDNVLLIIEELNFGFSVEEFAKKSFIFFCFKPFFEFI